MITVITYGTFDLFHYGHVRLLMRARSLGDRLVVGLSTDAFNNIKGKTACMTYAERHELLSSCRYVDDIIEEERWEQKESDIIAFKAKYFVMGDDWKGKFDFLSTICQVVYLPRTPEISSTELRSLRGSAVKRGPQ